ncbi:MAG: MFS transporter [Thermoguttaceae bacterium]|jgi:MFS family permease
MTSEHFPTGGQRPSSGNGGQGTMREHGHPQNEHLPLGGDQPSPALRRADPYAAWRIRNYQFYAAAWFLMTCGREIETLAIGRYVYVRTADLLALGWLGLVRFLPVVLLAIAGGQIADRRDRRLVVAVTLAVTMLMSLGLTAACWLHASVGWLYLLLGISSVAQALGGPSRSAMLPQIVPAEGFSNAVAWNSSVFQVASMIGPAFGGVLLALDPGPGVPLALAAVVACRLLSLAAVAGIPGRRPDAGGPSISLESLLAGVRFVVRQKTIFALITLDLFAVLFGGAAYLLPVFQQDILEAGPSALGYLRSAEAAGAIAMAVLLAHLPPIARAGRMMLWAVAGFGAATIVFGLSRNLWLSLFALFLVGAFDNVSVVVRHTLVQMLTPDAMRGRVSAVNNVFIVSSNDLGGFESGVTAWMFGPIWSVVGGGIGTILVVLGAAWKWPHILALGSLGDIRPADAAQAEGTERLEP